MKIYIIKISFSGAKHTAFSTIRECGDCSIYSTNYFASRSFFGLQAEVLLTIKMDK